MPSVRSKSRPASSATQPRKQAQPRRQPDRSPTGKAYALLLGIVLVVATVALYYPTTHHPFGIFDDDIYVTGNRQIKAGLSWDTVKWASTTLYACNWHPLTWLSHAADCQFFGLDPSGHHSVNLLLHVLNVLLLFVVLSRATRAVGPSFVVAALFALHPINVETVAWVAERKNLLSLVFFLLALGAYGWYARAPRLGRYAAVFVLYVLALLSKPQVITFPFVLLLWDYWPLRRMFADSAETESSVSPRTLRWLILEKLPLLALSAASAVVTVQAQRASGAIRWFPLLLRVENAIVAYARYVAKALWPAHLALIYPHPEKTLDAWQVLASLLFLLAVTALVIKERRRRYLLVGWFWFLGTLVPMIGLVQVGGQAMADRYAYLSFIGLFLMICWGVREWAAQQRIPIRWLAGASAAVLLALAAVTYHQIDYWADNVRLWQHTLDITTRNWLAENNLGAALLSAGRPEEAIAHFRNSEAIYPGDPVSHLDVGYYELQHADFPGAMAEFHQVLVLAPKQDIAAEAYNDMGFGYRRLGDNAKAKENFEAAVKINPQHYRAWIGLGVTTQKGGDVAGAIEDYSASVRAEPSDLGYLLLAQALELQGRTAEAQAATAQARAISPNFDQAQHIVRGLVSH